MCIYDIILFAHVHSQIVAAASIRGGVYFAQRLKLCGVYSRAASIRGNTAVQKYSGLVDAFTLHLKCSPAVMIQQQQMSLFHCPSLSCRSLRSSTTGVLLINLCLALIALYVSFIISHYVLVSDESCAAFSFVFHYLVLVSSFALTTMAVFRVLDPLGRKVVFGLAIAADWCKLISLSSIECQHVFFMLSVVVLCLSFLFLCAVIPVVIVAVSFGPRYTNYISDEL